MRKKIAKADIPNASGRIYPKEVVEEMANDINNRDGKILCYSEGSGLIDDIVGVVSDAKVEDNELSVTIDILNTPNGVHIKDMLKCVSEDNFEGVITGTGCVDKDNIVSDYKLTGVLFKLKDK